MGKGQRTNKKGRGGAALADFVALERYMLKGVAWRSLKPVARSAYVEIAFGYDGANNGRVQMAARTLADRLGMDKATAARAINELETKGFIEIAKRSSFDFKLKQCQEYRLTAFRCDVTGELPTKTFMRWTPEIQNTVAQVQPNSRTHATEGLKTTQNSPFQLHPRNRKGAKPPDHSCTHAPLLYSTIGGAASEGTTDLPSKPESSSPSPQPESPKAKSSVLRLPNAGHMKRSASTAQRRPS